MKHVHHKSYNIFRIIELDILIKRLQKDKNIFLAKMSNSKQYSKALLEI